MLQDRARAIARSVARILNVPFITPNRLTVFGLVLNAGVAWLLATGNLLPGGIMLVFASLFDMLDGALAKITNRVSDFGAFLDSVVDRYSEAIVLLGLLLYYYGRPDRSGLTEIILIYIILVGSMMISYARARAGALKIRNEVGLMARPERIVILAIGLIFAEFLLVPALWILAVGTQITAIHRIVYVWLVTSGKRSDGGEKPEK
jgi:CDP-diacylglycerol--glycerol-3-phosphate 3-phosphatidyltransferase